MKKLFSAFAILVFLTGCQPPEVSDTKTPEKANQTQTGSQTQVVEPEKIEEKSLTPENTMSFDQTDLPQSGEKVAIMETTKGTIKIRLFEEKTPKTVENFVGLAEKGYYDGIIFHRVIPDFMIQGGDPTGTGRGGESFWGGKFEDEFVDELQNINGALSMANAGPATNGSQFFIVQKDGGTPWLDGMHTVFGQVFEGMDVVDMIANVERDPADKPLEDIKIVSVQIETQE